MRSTCGLKPMSSMRSASSRTSTATASSDDEPAVDEILQAARRRDDHVRVAAPRRACAFERHAAVDGRDLDRRRRRPAANSSVTCDAELARRDEHERGGPAVGRVEALDDRDRERERLARAGRALREDVAAAKRLRDDERLDLERRVDAARCEQLAHGLGHAERTKICQLVSTPSDVEIPCPKAGDAISRERGLSALRHDSR